MELCEFNCGKEAKFSLKNGKKCCSKFSTQCGTNRKKNSNGLKRAYEDGTKKVIFTDEHRLKGQKSYKEFLKNAQPFELWGKQLRKLEILKDQDYKCLWCKLNRWLDKELSLHLDHIDGNHNNNKRENLRLLCPNCHSLTDTYCGKNKNTGYRKISDKDLYASHLKSKSFTQALKLVGLAPVKYNIDRLKELIKKKEN